MYGWMGKVLFVNLNERMAEVKPLCDEIAHTFIGGRGLGARMLWELVDAKVEPYSPDNALIFATGPLTATGFQTSGRFSVSTKSPLTDTILDCNCGGVWGVRFKQTGHDVLVITGQADSPVYLEISPEGVRFKDASELWGKTVSQTTEALGGKNRSVLCIGPAGENLVRFASIMVDKSRALGRGGPGAVMGAKKLKAIVVSGDKRPGVYNPELFNFVRYEATKLLRANPVTSQGLPLFGTA
ncbi:MAG: aldehyde ferredoxin oxidoreductase N-terminal domain-containing protein, partial [Anaerolineae bacterium]|nr:aldehyde ferredoxin oxidoreductase N-terminal domain-containing protein [Anaerolineae bacterium]